MGCCEGTYKEYDLVLRDSESRLKIHPLNKETQIKDPQNGLSPGHNLNHKFVSSPGFAERGEHQTSPISFVPTLELPENPCEVSLGSWSGINKLPNS